MEFRIQYFMTNASLGQSAAQLFTGFDGNGTNQHRLSLGMSLFNGIYNCTKFFFLGLVYRILKIHTGNGLIGRHFNNIHTVNLAEFILLG